MAIGELLLKFFGTMLLHGLIMLFLILGPNPVTLPFSQLLLSLTSPLRHRRRISNSSNELLILVAPSLTTILLHRESLSFLEIILELQIIEFPHIYGDCGFLRRYFWLYLLVNFAEHNAISSQDIRLIVVGYGFSLDNLLLFGLCLHEHFWGRRLTRLSNLYFDLIKPRFGTFLQILRLILILMNFLLIIAHVFIF